MIRMRKGSLLEPAVCCVSLLGMLAVLAMSTAAPAVAVTPAPVCGVSRTPLLTVDSHRFQNFGAIQTEATAFFFTDGTVVYSERIDTYPSVPQTLPTYSSVTRSAVSKDLFAAFVTALDAVRPGYAKDCYDNDSDTGDYTEYRFTWYGKGTRQNSFVVSPNITAPACGAEFDALELATLTAVQHALVAPGAETLSSGPFH